MATLTFHGHSACEIRIGGRHIWIDPFLTGNPKAVMDPGKVEADSIVLTHGHGDHLGDTVAIAKRTGATVYCNYEIMTWLTTQGLTKFEPANTGGTVRSGNVKITFVEARHSSSIDVNGVPSYLGVAHGVLVRGEGKRVYHMGDTALFSDIRLITERRGPFDVALVPTGDRFTMGLEDALVAARWVNARMTIPVHCGTFDLIEDNGQDFVRKLARLGTNGQLLEPGQTIEF
jgi:L-ascorbate metabolism protein UlaG (beta-lactamase superfamily)